MTITIPLSKGYAAIVDDLDAKLAEHKWTVVIGRCGNLYAKRVSRMAGKNITVMMHRLIYSRAHAIDLTSRQEIDHVDRNGLNNCRRNLRLATRQQNSFNSRIQSNNKSGATGVIWMPPLNKWRARIKVDGVLHHLGVFITFEDAVEARRQSELTLFGEFAPIQKGDGI